MNKIAIFDVCGTLYNSNTTYDFIDFFLKKKNKKRYLVYRLMKSMLFKPLWKSIIVVSGNNNFNRKVFLSLLKGFNVNDVKNEADFFVANFLEQRKIVALHKHLGEHLEKEHHVILLSASIEPVVEAIARHLKVTSFFSTQLGITNEHYNGKLDFDMEGKKKHKFHEHYSAVSEKYVYFYSDNKEDIDLLNVVDEPTVVSFESDYETHWKLKKTKDSTLKFIIKI